ERHAWAAVTGARTTHHLRRSIAARVLLAEAVGRLRKSAGDARLRAVDRLVSASTPLIKARWALRSMPSGDIDRHIAATGLSALTLFVPRPPGRGSVSRASEGFAENIVRLLHVCQTAEDETIVLKQVCERVRADLDAASVAFVDLQLTMVACDGPRMD